MFIPCRLPHPSSSNSLSIHTDNALYLDRDEESCKLYRANNLGQLQTKACWLFRNVHQMQFLPFIFCMPSLNSLMQLFSTWGHVICRISGSPDLSPICQCQAALKSPHITLSCAGECLYRVIQWHNRCNFMARRLLVCAFFVLILYVQLVLMLQANYWVKTNIAICQIQFYNGVRSESKI